jgi:hypothetical protein
MFGELLGVFYSRQTENTGLPGFLGQNIGTTLLGMALSK